MNNLFIANCRFKNLHSEEFIQEMKIFIELILWRVKEDREWWMEIPKEWMDDELVKWWIPDSKSLLQVSVIDFFVIIFLSHSVIDLLLRFCCPSPPCWATSSISLLSYMYLLEFYEPFRFGLFYVCRRFWCTIILLCFKFKMVFIWYADIHHYFVMYWTCILYGVILGRSLNDVKGEIGL